MRQGFGPGPNTRSGSGEVRKHSSHSSSGLSYDRNETVLRDAFQQFGDIIEVSCQRFAGSLAIDAL
ncbi:hypothetical protein CDL15_Pgr025005 [Punica granatum]|uniref:RRM domain-containing protein n=1 Tax=Punica granatum TaxID=22663 RepID=A0A218W8K9_PUNGR|nr:hypothetical protein CDL15_Pgr025005 [Punica granatum]